MVSEVEGCCPVQPAGEPAHGPLPGQVVELQAPETATSFPTLHEWCREADVVGAEAVPQCRFVPALGFDGGPVARLGDQRHVVPEQRRRPHEGPTGARLRGAPRAAGEGHHEDPHERTELKKVESSSCSRRRHRQ